MRFGWWVAAAALVVAGQAQAADYLTYDFTVDGTATRNVQPSLGTYYSLSGHLTGDVVFVMPADIAGQPGAVLDQPFTSLFAQDDLSWTASAGALQIGEGVTSYAKGPTRTLSLTACGAIGGAIPGTGVAIDPGCSSVSFFRGLPTGLYLAGDGASFTGTVTRLTVTEGFGTPAALGLVDVPVLPIPEPASWLLTILGTGLAGMALRRARRRAAMPA